MTVWGTFKEMEDLRREIDRVFQGFEGGRWPSFRRLAFLPGLAARQYPLVNLHEDNDNLYVEALAPGVDPEQARPQRPGHDADDLGREEACSATCRSGTTIGASGRPGRFVRTVELPYPVRDDGTAATYKQGLLLITLPKHEAAKPKQISVHLG